MRVCWVCVSQGGGWVVIIVSGSEEQMSWEEASGAQAWGFVAGLQPHLVSPLQLKHSVPRWQVMASLIHLETAKHQLFVTPQVHTPCVGEGGVAEAELIDTWDDTCKYTCLCVVVVLFVVDDLMEMNNWFRR